MCMHAYTLRSRGQVCQVHSANLCHLQGTAGLPSGLGLRCALMLHGQFALYTVTICVCKALKAGQYFEKLKSAKQSFQIPQAG